MISETYSKEIRRWIDRVRLPSAHCQACLSDKSPGRDFIITCELCQSSIHNLHYGRQIQEHNQPYDKWHCERCRMICQYVTEQKYFEIQNMRCHFCPNNRGILKRIIYNNNETIWLHPECYTWPYPIIYQKNNRRIHFNCEYPTKPTGKFWVNLDGQAQAACQICKQAKGYKIKCMYYSCFKYYHCSCAKTIGMIRDLQSMMFENVGIYIPPYCLQHLKKRIEDCSLKMKKYRSVKDELKATHFSQMIVSYSNQLQNMQKSAKKYQQQEKIRMQMEYQVGQKEDIMEDLSFQEGGSFHSNHPESFYQYIFDGDYPKRKSTHKKSGLLSIKKQPEKMDIQPPLINLGEKKVKNESNLHSNIANVKIAKYDKQSQFSSSEWHHSSSIQDD